MKLPKFIQKLFAADDKVPVPPSAAELADKKTHTRFDLGVSVIVPIEPKDDFTARTQTALTESLQEIIAHVQNSMFNPKEDGTVEVYDIKPGAVKQ